MHHCSKLKAPFAGASPPCLCEPTPLSLPPRAWPSSITLPLVLLHSPRRFKLGSRRGHGDRVLRGGQQDTLVEHRGRQKIVILHPQLLQHFCPCETSFLSQEGSHACGREGNVEEVTVVWLGAKWEKGGAEDRNHN